MKSFIIRRKSVNSTYNVFNGTWKSGKQTEYNFGNMKFTDVDHGKKWRSFYSARRNFKKIEETKQTEFEIVRLETTHVITGPVGLNGMLLPAPIATGIIEKKPIMFAVHIGEPVTNQMTVSTEPKTEIEIIAPLPKAKPSRLSNLNV